MIFWPKNNDMFNDILAQKLLIFLHKFQNNFFAKYYLKNIVKNIVIFFWKNLIFLANIKNFDIIIAISKYDY